MEKGSSCGMVWHLPPALGLIWIAVVVMAFLAVAVPLYHWN
jgi:hypothetical protein